MKDFPSKQQPSSTFCVVPWTQVATNAGGRFRVCCNALPGENIVKDAANQAMHATKNSVSEVWSSPTYKKIRHEMLNSIRPKMCQRCFREEDSGIESARQRLGSRNTENDIFKNPDPPLNVKYLDLRLGNLCNLKCRMCNPYSSSKWADEWNSIADSATLVPNEKLSNDEIQYVKSMDWPTNQKTWENLSPILNSIEEIYLTGGEPFLSIEQTKLLEKMVSSGRSKEITLKYNTNLTVLPEKLTRLWENFKTVRLNVSIDAVGELNDYIRAPSQWLKIEKNMYDLLELQNNTTDIQVGIHTTVQMYNILDLHDIIESFEKRFGLLPYLNILNHPHCLNIRVLPNKLKNTVNENLQALSKYSEVEKVIRYMNGESWNEKYFGEFISYTNKLDQVRGNIKKRPPGRLREIFQSETNSSPPYPYEI